MRARTKDQADDRYLQEHLRGVGHTCRNRSAEGAVQERREPKERLHPVPTKVQNKQLILTEAEEQGEHPAVSDHLPRHRTASPT